MKPLALALAVTVLGSGCIVVDDDGPAPCASDLALDWDFQLFDASVAGCFDAAVEWVDVWVDGQLVDTFDCYAGGGTVWGPAGSAVTVEGVEANGRIAFRDWLTAPGGCGTRFASTRPAEGIANLNYSAPGGCTSSPCYLWYAVFDYEANGYTAVIDQSSPAAVKTLHPYPNDVEILLPVGSHRLDWMELVGSSFFGEAMTCSAAGFDVAAASVTTVPATLSAACVP
jgi:hypothetical protein